MLSPQRLAANRRNAQKSTGPRTDVGKSAASINGLKSGIHSNRLLLPSEDPAELAAITRAWRSQSPDPTPAESRLIDAQIHSYWLLHRLARIESDLKEQEATSALHSAVETLRSLKIGRSHRSRELRAAARRNDQFMQLARRRDALTVDFHNAQYELTKLRAARQTQATAATQPQQNIPSATGMGPFLRMAIPGQPSQPVAEL